MGNTPSNEKQKTSPAEGVDKLESQILPGFTFDEGDLGLSPEELNPSDSLNPGLLDAESPISDPKPLPAGAIEGGCVSPLGSAQSFEVLPLSPAAEASNVISNADDLSATPLAHGHHPVSLNPFLPSPSPLSSSEHVPVSTQPLQSACPITASPLDLTPASVREGDVRNDSVLHVVDVPSTLSALPNPHGTCIESPEPSFPHPIADVSTIVGAPEVAGLGVPPQPLSPAEHAAMLKRQAAARAERTKQEQRAREKAEKEARGAAKKAEAEARLRQKALLEERKAAALEEERSRKEREREEHAALKEQERVAKLSARELLLHLSPGIDALAEEAGVKPDSKQRSAGAAVAVSGAREVKSLMSENVQRLQERGERLASLADRTAEMNSEAERFAANVRKLRQVQENRKWWQ